MFRSTYWYWWPWGFVLLACVLRLAQLVWAFAAGAGGLAGWAFVVAALGIGLLAALSLRGSVAVDRDGVTLGGMISSRVPWADVTGVELGASGDFGLAARLLYPLGDRQVLRVRFRGPSGAQLSRTAVLHPGEDAELRRVLGSLRVPVSAPTRGVRPQ